MSGVVEIVELNSPVNNSCEFVYFFSFVGKCGRPLAFFEGGGFGYWYVLLDDCVECVGESFEGLVKFDDGS